VDAYSKSFKETPIYYNCQTKKKIIYINFIRKYIPLWSLAFYGHFYAHSRLNGPRPYLKGVSSLTSLHYLWLRTKVAVKHQSSSSSSSSSPMFAKYHSVSVPCQLEKYSAEWRIKTPERIKNVSLSRSVTVLLKF